MGLFKPKIRDQIYYYLFLILALSIPLHGKLIPPIIALIGLNWLLELNFKEKYARIKKSVHRKYILAFGILYMLYIVGISYSSVMHGQEGALFDLEVKLSLLIFPLLFATIDFSGFKSDFFKMVQKAFVLGSIIGSVFLFNNAVLSYFYENDFSVFYYSNLSAHFHPSYLAMYFTFDVAIILSWLIGNRQINSSKKTISILLILYFQVFIILLSSKAGILSVGVIYIIFAIYIFLNKSYRTLTSVLTPLLLLISFVAILFMFPRSYGRFVSVVSSIEHEETLPANTHESSAARILVWKSAIEVIKDNSVFGVGTGDVKQELRKVYKEKNIESAYEDHLNAHNQFIQTTVALGIIGLLVLLSFFILPFIYAYKNNNPLYILFLAIIGFHFLFESMLERQAGVVFYAFFNSLLFYFMDKKK